MDAVQLTERIEELEQARRHWQGQLRLAQTNLNACEGALSECRHWLKVLSQDGEKGTAE